MTCGARWLRGGASYRLRYWQLREATGLSLSLGTLMLARGELLTEEGEVYAPEVCLHPQKFIAYMSAKGIKAYEDLAKTWQIA